MKQTNRNLFLLLSLTALLSACEMKSNLNEMHDSTVEMNKTTKEMNERTTGLGNATDELYNALRQGDSLAARRSALENLIKTPDASRKISEAAKYFMSYEFQFWTNEGQDKGEEKRFEHAALGAREFFKDIQQFIPDGKLTPKPFKGQIFANEKSNLVNCLNALSVTSHFLNPKQEQYLKDKKSMTALSMNKMIEDSLMAKAAIESGQKRLSDYPAYVSEILANESVAIYLLEARYNYLAALFLGRSTNIAHSKLVASKILLTEWTLDLSRFNLAQVAELNMLLSASLKTKQVLVQIGVKPRTDALLARMLNNMKLENSAKTAVIPEKAGFFKEITATLAELKKF